MDHKTSLINKEIKNIEEKMTPIQKIGIQRALGSKHPSNLLRKTSRTARTLIDLVKNKKIKDELETVDEALGTIKNMKAATKFGQSNIARMDREEKARKISLSPKQKKIDLNHNNKIDGEDLAGLRAGKHKMTKEEVVQVDEVTDLTEVLKASDPVGKWIDDFTHSKDPKFNGKSKEERRKMALGAYYNAQKESYENSTEELAEGRGRPPKEGSKAWHAAKTKSLSGESSDQEADKNIRTQLQKAVSVGKSVTFNNGETKKIEPTHAHKALALLDNTPKPADKEVIQKSLSHSHDRFHATIKSGKPVTDTARPKVSLGSMKREQYEIDEDVDPSTTRVDRGAIVVKKVRKADGSYAVVATKKGRTHPKDIIDAQESYDLSDEVTNSLNNLYNSLSEQNKELFEERIMTEAGVFDLINFARKQGF